MIFYQIKQKTQRKYMLYMYCVCIICVAHTCCIYALLYFNKNMFSKFVVWTLIIFYQTKQKTERTLLCYDKNIFSKYVFWTSVIFYQTKQNAERTCAYYVCCVCVLHFVAGLGLGAKRKKKFFLVVIIIAYIIFFKLNQALI